MANEGTDEVRTARASYTLGIVNVENLTGTATIGQALTGSSIDNTIAGGTGSDTLDGGAGNDTLIGGRGNDIYIVDSVGDTIIEAANEGTDEVRTTLSSYSMAAAGNVEKLTGTAATGQALTGNSLDNTMTGGAGDDTLDGGAGNDTLIGGPGNDTLIGGLGNDAYIIDSAGDTVTEAANEGTDEVRTSFASYSLAALVNVENLRGTAATGQVLTGNELDNAITGGTGNDTLDGLAGNDTLDGGAGSDSMIGGLGNDVYVVGSASDTVIEAADEGIDTVRTTLASYSLTTLVNVENLTGTAQTGQTLIGNSLDNIIIAGGFANDTLDGGAGNDTMTGGVDNDIYVVDSYGDIVIEAANGGIDEVRTTLAAYSLASLVNVENLTDTAATDQTLTGNDLSNTITGGTGNDALDGGVGADVLVGGAGDDTYFIGEPAFVGIAFDWVSEKPGEGIDTVNTWGHYTLAANLENLVLLGSADLQGCGNDIANTLTGNSGINLLDGGVGADS